MDRIWFSYAEIENLVQNKYGHALKHSQPDGYYIDSDGMQLKPVRQISLRKDSPGHVQTLSRQALLSKKAAYLFIEIKNSRITINPVNSLP